MKLEISLLLKKLRAEFDKIILDVTKTFNNKGYYYERHRAKKSI